MRFLLRGSGHTRLEYMYIWNFVQIVGVGGIREGGRLAAVIVPKLKKNFRLIKLVSVSTEYFALKQIF